MLPRYWHVCEPATASKRSARTHLHVAGEVWAWSPWWSVRALLLVAGRKWCRVIERCCQRLRDDLLSFDLVRDIALDGGSAHITSKTSRTYLVVDATLEIPRSRVMSGAARNERDEDHPSEDRQFWFSQSAIRTWAKKAVDLLAWSTCPCTSGTIHCDLRCASRCFSPSDMDASWNARVIMW